VARCLNDKHEAYTCGCDPRWRTSGDTAATPLLRVRSDGTVEVNGALQVDASAVVNGALQVDSTAVFNGAMQVGAPALFNEQVNCIYGRAWKSLLATSYRS